MFLKNLTIKLSKYLDINKYTIDLEKNKNHPAS